MEMGLAGRINQDGWRPQLTPWEKRVGWCFFALYLFVFPFAVGGVLRLLDDRLALELTLAQTNSIYYAIVLLLLIAVFWDFLRHAGRILRDNFRPSLFTFGIGLLAGLAGTCLMGVIPVGVQNPVIEDYCGQHYMSAAATWAVVVFLRPAVEEILYRGLFFGSLRKGHRALAYALSTGLFALGSVWQYVAIPELGPAALLLALQYLPLGLVTCWSYDVSGSVYTPMALRMALQAAFLLFAVTAGQGF